MFENNLDRFGYERIIQTHLKNFVDQNYRGFCKLIQDNDPKHTSRICRRALVDNRIVWVYFFGSLILNINQFKL